MLRSMLIKLISRKKIDRIICHKFNTDFNIITNFANYIFKNAIEFCDKYENDWACIDF